MKFASIHTGSLATSGIAVWPGTGVYCASKFALEAIGRALRDEVQEFGIAVTNVAPKNPRRPSSVCPAVIVAVVKEGHLLMGHGINFPSGRYSVLAGFTEPGENLEGSVMREIYEESHIHIKNINYFGSQPWPFPHSLMVGFTAEWESGEIVPELSEVTDVRWFAPKEIPDYYRGINISARLIEDFIRKYS